MLALTSNKEGPEVQHARTDDGGTVAGRVLDHLRALNAGAEPLGSFGAVVGATIGDPDEDLDINGPLLAPGYGAQGGTVADLRRIFGAGRRAPCCPAPRASCSRAGPDPRALGDAARRANDELAGLRRMTGAARPAAGRRWLLRCCCRSPAAAATRRRSYCAAVREHQQELTEIVSGGGQDALIRALDIFEDLRGKAPSDVTDEWQQVVTRIEALDQALRDAGVDPATYDRAKPAAGPQRRAERAASTPPPASSAAASTLDALAALDQEARDVCRTPLSSEAGRPAREPAADCRCPRGSD